jgi:hypothetical protein
LFPAWAELLGRAVRCRDGHGGAFTIADALAAADLVDAVAEDARARWE